MAGSDWQVVSLGEVCAKIGSGATPRGGKDSYSADGPFTLIRSQNVHNRGFLYEGLAFIDERQASGLKNVEVFAGDVLLNITGDSVARVCQVAPDVLPARVNQHVAIIRPNHRKLSARFLRYFLLYPETQRTMLSLAGSGGTRNALTKGIIESFTVRAPREVAQQEAIAHILGTLDDKIELNRRMNGTLEAMVRSLFKSWFVDFDPVRAKMERRDTGLPSHLDDLFPCKMMDSEFGPIPAGWRMATLDAIATLNPESWKRESAPSVVAYVDLKNTKWGTVEKVLSYDWGKAPTRARRVLRRDDTIVGTVRPGNGSYALISEDGLTGSTGFAVLRPRCRQSRELLWCSATSRSNIDRLAHLADGGAYPAVRPEVLGETPIVLADAPVRRAFGEVTCPLIDRIGGNRRESVTLSSLRDSLLPKLVSGDLRVDGGGSTIEAAR